MFITFEGPEGCGKTTQIQLLARWLADAACDVLTTREPGGTRIGNAIRNDLLNPAYTEIRPETEVLLFSAARAQIVGESIRPHLARGGVVLCDRFADSTLAYQGYGRQMDLGILRTITAFATQNLVPDLTIYLDVPANEGLRRKQGCAESEWNRMERERLEFHERVRAGYLALAAAEPARWLVLDGMQPIADIQGRIRNVVTARMPRATQVPHAEALDPE
jgi:dTMP kinase